MTKSTRPVASIVGEIVEVGIAQSEALWERDTRLFNRLYDRRKTLENELRRRTGDQRMALVALYDHPNVQVRLNAAQATLAINRQPARRLLEAIRESGHQPQGLDAGMTISGLDSGAYKPT